MFTLSRVHLQARYIQKQATFSDENFTQKLVRIRLFVAVKYAASARSRGALKFQAFRKFAQNSFLFFFSFDFTFNHLTRFYNYSVRVINEYIET